MIYWWQIYLGVTRDVNICRGLFSPIITNQLAVSCVLPTNWQGPDTPPRGPIKVPLRFMRPLTIHVRLVLLSYEYDS